MALEVLNCATCQNQLTNPITLSCGYTICSTCLTSANKHPKFVCPVKQCNIQSHLFGPSLVSDQIIEQLLHQDYSNGKESCKKISAILECPIGGSHCLQQPVTCHCGHTFCKLCLLKHRISNDSCPVCEKRLPSFHYVQQQSLNYIISNIISIFHQVSKQYNILNISKSNSISISFSNFNRLDYENVPIFLAEFPILPSQKIRLPINTQEQRAFFLESILYCEEYQSLCFGVLKKNKGNHLGLVGTMVKINNIEQRPNDLVIDVTGLDRFQVTKVHKEADDCILVDLNMKFEAKQDLYPFMQESFHWTDTSRLEQHILSIYTPPSPSISTVSNIMLPSFALPATPPAETMSNKEFATKPMEISNQIHEFISELAHSTPSRSFFSALEGLLGPVWLQSVQNLHGKIPPADHAIAMCWWVAVVLPISNNERLELLQIEHLEKRLNIVLSWIDDLKSQWSDSRRNIIEVVKASQ